MIFPRREDATNKDLILTIIEIQGYLSRYGKSHTNWHETLNEVVARLEQEPCKDAVSRVEVLEQINCWIGSGEYHYTNATDYLNKRIKGLQTVNPQKSIINNGTMNITL